MFLHARRHIANAVQTCASARACSSLQQRLAAGPDLNSFLRTGAAPLGLPDATAAAPAGRTVWLETCAAAWLPYINCSCSGVSACTVAAIHKLRYTAKAV